jgi:broad specificity phosphatase PhoE
MSSQVHLFRHAQAYHNSTSDNSLHDPRLTPDGIAQAKAITKNYQFLNKPTLILVSPLRRCIQTALYAFHPAFNKDVRKWFPTTPTFIALPQLQECSAKPCDTGSSLDILKKEFPFSGLFKDTGFESENWLNKSEGTPYADDSEMLSKRAEFVRNYIRRQWDNEIIIVTHGDFSHHLVNQYLYGPGCGSLFNPLNNAEGVSMALPIDRTNGDEMRTEIPPWFEQL